MTRTNLPSDASTLVGRQSELGELARLQASGARLITIVGPPGAGKTRLARAYAARSCSEVGGDAWLCDAAAVRSWDDVAAVVGSALRLALDADAKGSEVSAATVPQDLEEMLPQVPSCTLVLDDFEGVAEEATERLERWLEVAPELRLIVSSRRRTRARGEQCVELGPLPVADAVQLFAERAQSARPGFELEPVRDEVTELVERLDRLPFAIELAASRIRVLPPRDMLQRLDSRFELLRAKEETGRGLAEALEWSFELLSEQERSALCQCSIFHGFSLTSAEAVVQLSGVRVADAIERLADSSLVHCGESQAFPGEARFTVYESVRELAWSKLDCDAKKALQARHAEHYLKLGEELARGSRGPTGAQCLDRLEQEVGNLTRLAQGSDAGLAAQAALCLQPLREVRGPLYSHVRLLERIGERLSEAQHPRLLAELTLARGHALMVQGRFNLSFDALDAAAELAARGGAEAVAREVRLLLGLVLQWRGDYSEAEQHVPRTTQRSNFRDAALVLRCRGTLSLNQGNLEHAVDCFVRAADEAQQAGDRRSVGLNTLLQGTALFELRQPKLARQRFLSGLELVEEHGTQFFQAIGRFWLALLELEEGRHDLALALLEDAEKRLSHLGDTMFRPSVAGYLGVLYLDQGDLERAAGQLASAVHHARRESDYYRLGTFLPFLGYVRLEQRDELGAGEAFEEAHQVAAKSANPNLPVLIQVLEEAAHGPATPRVGTPPSARSEIAHIASRSSDVRFGLRIMRKRHALSSPIPEQVSSPPPAPSLVIGREGSYFQLPGRARVELTRRWTLRGVLWRLVQERVAKPGANLSTQQLISAGWPGERILAEAGVHRLHVVIATLRKLGLRDVLQTGREGYLLDPETPVSIGET